MISVITPTHDTRWLSECHRSLQAQTKSDWEWVILLNGEATLPPILHDDRVKVFNSVEKTKNIGTLKREAAKCSRGSILLELDHDDWLMPTALEKVQDAFNEDSGASMIWSDYAYMDENGEPSSFSYSGDWEYTSEFAYGKRWHRIVGKPTTPENISRIWTAPNHLRAWSTEKYWQVGGHADLDILDDQELMQKLYSVGLFVHIPEMLYIQRRHGLNTQIDPEINAKIQKLTVEMGDIWLAERF